MIPNDYALLKAYAIGLAAFERRDINLLTRAVILMNNRAVRLGYSKPTVLRLWTLNKPAVEALTDEQLNEFMGMCEIEPADFDNCLACYAYEVVQERDERGVNIVDSTSTFNLLILTVTVTAPLSQTVQVSEHMAPRVRPLLV